MADQVTLGIIHAVIILAISFGFVAAISAVIEYLWGNYQLNKEIDKFNQQHSRK